MCRVFFYRNKQNNTNNNIKNRVEPFVITTKTRLKKEVSQNIQLILLKTKIVSNTLLVHGSKSY